jgi:hypothetical protein
MIPAGTKEEPWVEGTGVEGVAMISWDNRRLFRGALEPLYGCVGGACPLAACIFGGVVPCVSGPGAVWPEVKVAILLACWFTLTVGSVALRESIG